MDKQIKKDQPRGSYRVAEGANVLGEGNADSDHAHVKRVTPLDTKRKELANDPQYAPENINREREGSTSRKRNDKDIRPL